MFNVCNAVMCQRSVALMVHEWKVECGTLMELLSERENQRDAFHKSGRLVSEQNPGEPNPLLQMAINTSHPPTWPC